MSAPVDNRRFPGLREWFRGKLADGTIAGICLSVAVLVALRVPGYDQDGLGEVLAEVDTVIIGVLIGLLVTPDSMRVLRQAELNLLAAPGVISRVSDTELTKLVHDILAVRSSPDIAQLATQHGWKPILDAWQREGGSIVHIDQHYDIELSGPHPRPLSTPVYWVETVLRAERYIPLTECWVSFARSTDALRREFTEAACLSRELVEVSEADWEILLERGAMNAEISYDGRPVPSPRAERPSTDLFRLHFVLPEPVVGVRSTVEMRMEFLLYAQLRAFPVRFPTYFCVGQTEVSLRMNDPAITKLDAMVNFAGDTELAQSPEPVGWQPRQSPSSRSLRIWSSKNVALWPGSGVIFFWDSEEHE